MIKGKGKLKRGEALQEFLLQINKHIAQLYTVVCFHNPGHKLVLCAVYICGRNSSTLVPNLVIKNRNT